MTEQKQDQLTKHQKYQLFLASLATIGGIVTVLIGISGYRAEQRSTRDSRRDEAVRDQELREEEIKRRIEELNASVWQHRLEIYGRVARDIGMIAATCEADPNKDVEQLTQFQTAARNFWQAYWGDMSLIEDKLVEYGMILYGEALETWAKELAVQVDDKTISPGKMKDLSYFLAHVYRKSLSRTWNPEHAFDKELSRPTPLHQMYDILEGAGLNVIKYKDKVEKYDQ